MMRSTLQTESGQEITEIAQRLELEVGPAQIGDVGKVENLALGVRQMKSETLQIQLVLKRLLEKGRIVFKRAYCDWSNYRDAVRKFHTHGIQMIDIPQSKASGKNSADIHMVVDALDLCYAKQHIDIFALLSGDSDFSPLVSKLRENNKKVIGLGVKKATSNLLVENCDEFIYYDDLVRRQPARAKSARSGARRRPGRGRAGAPKAEVSDKKREAFDLILETYEALVAERGEGEKIWGSMIKQTLKRRQPGFSESHYGFRSFGQLLEEAEKHGMKKMFACSTIGVRPGRRRGDD